MDVDAAEAREVEHGLGQDQPIRHDDQHIRRPGHQLSSPLLGLEGQRLKNGKIVSERCLFDSAGDKLTPSAFRAVRLSQDADDSVA